MTYTLHVATNGDDANDGSCDNPVYSLHRCQDIIKNDNPTENVEVRIGLGTYTYNETVVWDHYVDDQTISFAPENYTLEEGGWTDRPLFDGQGMNDWWFDAQPASNAVESSGRLRFYYLEVHNYMNGLRFRGDTVTNLCGRRSPVPDEGVDNNRLYGMMFQYIGSTYASGDPDDFGFAAVDLVNSSNNQMTNIFARNLENDAPHESHIHSVYFAHGSSDNLWKNVVNKDVSGDPIRVRNVSNDNRIEDNDFTTSGRNGFYSEWFVTEDYVANNYPYHLESVSLGNEFYYNTLNSGYDGGYLDVWYLITTAGFNGDEVYFKGTLPGLDPNEARLSTLGNTRP